ncbi:SHOCT domain-containing protein [Cohnella massiliensis]|uniref:SHOCT domain-containing protein n=1 Tax=Cohnella massiliensis TaxID=1816691 RepID=UPI0009B95162|nr:SHOCT domain-containing protein [Cohnella massiliensis]
MMNGSMMMDNSMMIMMCIVMLVGLLLLIIAIGVTVYIVVRKLMRNGNIEDRPLMVLKERYAKGEISDEEYEHRRNNLSR